MGGTGSATLGATDGPEGAPNGPGRAGGAESARRPRDGSGDGSGDGGRQRSAASGRRRNEGTGLQRNADDERMGSVPSPTTTNSTLIAARTDPAPLAVGGWSSRPMRRRIARDVAAEHFEGRPDRTRRSRVFESRPDWQGIVKGATPQGATLGLRRLTLLVLLATTAATLVAVVATSRPERASVAGPDDELSPSRLSATPRVPPRATPLPHQEARSNPDDASNTQPNVVSDRVRFVLERSETTLPFIDVHLEAGVDGLTLQTDIRGEVVLGSKLRRYGSSWPLRVTARKGLFVGWIPGPPTSLHPLTVALVAQVEPGTRLIEVEGVVRDAVGFGPIGAATVRGSSPCGTFQTTSAKDGTFRLVVLAPEFGEEADTEILCGASGYVAESTILTSTSARNMGFTLQRDVFHGGVTVEVADATGAPVPNATVVISEHGIPLEFGAEEAERLKLSRRLALESEQGTDEPERASGRSNAAGAAVFACIRPGPVRVFASVGGAFGVSSSVVQPHSIAAVRITLTPTRELRIRIVHDCPPALERGRSEMRYVFELRDLIRPRWSGITQDGVVLLKDVPASREAGTLRLHGHAPVEVVIPPGAGSSTSELEVHTVAVDDLRVEVRRDGQPVEFDGYVYIDSEGTPYRGAIEKGAGLFPSTPQPSTTSRVSVARHPSGPWSAPRTWRLDGWVLLIELED